MRLPGQIVSTYLELVGDWMERHISVITVENGPTVWIYF